MAFSPGLPRKRLPWEIGMKKTTTPKGVEAIVVAHRDATPLGVVCFHAFISQGSACGATLGWRTQPLWGSTTDYKDVYEDQGNAPS